MTSRPDRLVQALRMIASTVCAIAAACRGADVPHPAGPPAAPGSLAPRLAMLGDRIVLSWLETGGANGAALVFATRDGSGWSAPKTVIRDRHLGVDPADVPGVVPLPGGALAAHWTVKPDSTSTYARDLEVSISTDAGATWTPPQRPHRDGTASEHGMATLVPGAEAGRFGIVWLDGRAGEQSEYGEGGTALYWADWNGTAFTPEVAIDPRVCDCCKTSATAGPTGALVAYRDRGEDERRDISLAREEGASWSSPIGVRDDGWRLTACPTNGPAIAALDGRAAVAWFTAAQGQPAVRAALSGDGGRSLGAPTRIDAGNPVGRVEATVFPDGSAGIVWLERTGASAEVRARRLAPDGVAAAPVTVAATGSSRKSGYPRIAATGARSVIVAWTDTTGPATVVRSADVTLP